MDKRLCIFTSSPNSYADVFGVFYKCFNKFWSDCPYEFVLATNDQQYEGITVVNNNDFSDNWMTRAIPALKSINTKYVLHIADDCFITEQVDNKEIESILDDMDAHGLNFCGLANKIKGKPLHKNSLLYRVNKRKPYAKNLQVGIFNREYLLQVLGDGSLSAWDIEKGWIAEMMQAPNEDFADVVAAKQGVITTLHGVAKGKWFPTVLKKLKKLGVEVESDREQLSAVEEKKINTIKKLGKLFSPSARRGLKKVLSKLGFGFSTDN